ncbi:MAG: EpsG family protein [Eubacteriales bacterium]|nr:EpsG family protein [Eubacteriales bacterium]
MVFLLVSGITLGLLFKKNRWVTFYLFIVLWITCGWSMGHADYYSYTALFEESKNFSWSLMEQPLFYGLMYILNYVGFTIQSVFIILGGLSAILLIKSSMDYTVYPNYVCTLFIIAVFFLYITQIRNYIAMAILIYAIRYLLPANRNIKKYIISMLIAAGFHISMLFYLLLIPLSFLSRKKTIMVTGIFTVALFVFQRFAYHILSAIGMSSYLVYLETEYETTTVLIYDVYIVAGIIGTMAVDWLIRKYRTTNITVSRDIIDMTSLIWKINMFMLVVIPLQSITIESVRIYRNILPLNFVIFSYLILKRNWKRRKLRYGKVEWLGRLMQVGIVSYAIIYSNLYIYRQCYETLVIPILENNLLLR